MTGFIYPVGFRVRLGSGSPVLTVVDVHPEASEITVEWPGDEDPLRAKTIMFDFDRMAHFGHLSNAEMAECRRLTGCLDS
ncbi:hypothetical protein [Devosia submarina]|uniref:hypothetical protein n=1 Tax=Devosia submarina TaxID=1173082 RepID=UPI000D35CDAE|nr:hypothetical protein [Devosia submarina]